MPKKAKLKPLPDYWKLLPSLSASGDQRKVATFRIKKARHNYEKTGNLLFVWEAYQAARKVNFPIPSWVEKYIDQVAERVLAVKEYTPEAVEYMMGFRKTPDGPGTGGGASLIRQQEKYLMKEFAIFFIIKHKERWPDKSIDEICEETTSLLRGTFDKDIKGETLKNWYYKRKS